MTATFDFDRLLAAVLETGGPQAVPEKVVEAALAQARDAGQRRPRVAPLDRNAWPPRRTSMANPATARLVLIVLAALLTTALVAASIGIGSRLLRNGPPGAFGWVTTGAMAEARTVFTATTLLDGRVLVAGGGTSESSGNFTSAEVFDPRTGTWTRVEDMADGRRFHTATLLIDGRVLVTGGGSLATAELFDPKTGTWRSAHPMSEPRGQHVAIRLWNGDVLVAGGTGGEAPTLTAEVYDPDTDTWTVTGAMGVWRASPTIELLNDGKVLVAGGFGPGVEITSAELYNPDTRSWTMTGTLHESRVDGSSATLLKNGEVLVVGGNNGQLPGVGVAGSTAELYDPLTGSWTLTARTIEGQGGHSATLMADGTVLVAGGISQAGAPIPATEYYHPDTASWAVGPSMLVARYSGLAAPLADGRVLVMGGTGAAGGPTTAAELFAPVGGD
jgi:hypothetical protein